MATRLSVLPCHTEKVDLSRKFLPPILQKMVGCNNNNPHPYHFFIYLATTQVNNSSPWQWDRRPEAIQAEAYGCKNGSLRLPKRCRRLLMKSMVDGTRSDAPKSSKNTTRLIRTIQSLQRKLSSRIKELRNGLSMKVLFFLLGFYCATAFATVIGQTGDWDILSAGLAVAVVEGIGAVMYRASSRFFDRIRGLITMFNYWKAGLTLGLFLDSFKYEMDTLLEKCNPFDIDIDIFHIFL